MKDLQTIGNSMIDLLRIGGVDATKELVRGRAINDDQQLSNIWREVFAEKLESRLLADQVAQNPKNKTAQEELLTLLKEVLARHPNLVQQVQPNVTTGNITAGKGGVAGAVFSGNVEITNSKDNN